MKHYCLLFKLLQECLLQCVLIAVLVLWGCSVSALAQGEVDQPPPAFAQDSAQANSEGLDQQLVELRAEFDRLRTDYERRIDELQAQMEDLQIQMLRAAPEGEPLAAAPTSASQSTYNALNPAISVIGNFIARGDSDRIFSPEGNRIDNILNLRATEIDMRVPVDPYADAVLIASFESETPGNFEAGIEEGYINIKKLPFMPNPLGLRFKVGRFRPDFGKFNVLHTHDLPQSFRSMSTVEFLGEEGFIQQGVSAEFYVPTPWGGEDSLNAKLQILDGGDIAVSPESHGKKAYLGNLRWFRTFDGTHNLDLGWSSYWHPGGGGESISRLHAVDFTYRWKPFRQGERKSYVLGGEVMFTDPRRASVDPAAPLRRPWGGSVFTQWQLDRRKYAGLRADYTKSLSEPGKTRRGVTPYLSYYFSEFFRLRLNYEHRWSDILAENGRNSVFLEFNWIFGAHPPEPFWVNK